ncbi:MAG: efflux RND transporter permease subunit [Betaproteobacteria bacterium]|uniref:efflux RND transporter permease subunit n=1 Tax=Ferrovum sp. PN-J185 TaxID=1356306 RepID=UPI00079896D6|nr:efflux RND transporter permease subunit [Ferrovum sp. PN-J185]KXW56799.1 multidrug resistance protein MdtC [Ferrovum sp. PN-J185]MDE2056108.1 efflux RND transporter permease subunit [Betaproteobacteria bacterium]
MWIVRLALRRPYTFIVLAILIVFLGTTSIKNTPTDIFPNIDIPVVSVIWTYSGLPPKQMEKYITTFSEYSLSAGVNDVRAIESQTLNGVNSIKIFFQPNVKIAEAVAQVVSISQTIIRRMPQGTVPPLILRYEASSVPVLQLALSSSKLNESQLYDFGIYRVRTAIAPVKGTRLPLPYGGKPRQIQVDLDPAAMMAKGITANDINNTFTNQNLSLPTGDAKIGSTDYVVAMNMNPNNIDSMNNLPIKKVNGNWVYVRDVAHVRDGFGVQTNIVRTNGERGALLTILKTGQASTLDVVNGIKELIPGLKKQYPDIHIEELFDQSIFVKAAIKGVLVEGLTAALLTAGMILLFLGSLRSTFIVVISIPLSILSSLIILYLTGETLNIMTLGGLALAVGILVDDATVEIENIHRNAQLGLPIEETILLGASQIFVPTFVSTLSICVVFVSVVFLNGPPRYLFTPLALAVVYAMMASWVLSRTLVPVMVKYLLPNELHGPHGSTIHQIFEKNFEAFRQKYIGVLELCLNHKKNVLVTSAFIVTCTVILLPFIGRDFFPVVDAGQIRMHVNAPAGLRLEETEQVYANVERKIKEIISPHDLNLILDNIGIPQSVNLAFTDTPTISSNDGEILISLKSDHKTATPDYVRTLRQELPRLFPGITFFFQPADIVSQILNFGIPAPIDVQIAGFNPKIPAIADDLQRQIALIPGAVDVHRFQVSNAPQINLDVDRNRAADLGMTEHDVANNVLIGLSSSSTISYNLWPDPRSGVGYPIAIQTPQAKISTLNQLMAINLPGKGNAQYEPLANVATFKRSQSPLVVSHYDIQPVFDIYANVEDQDLGSVSSKISTIIQQISPTLPPGTRLVMRGQVESMSQSYVRLGIGIIVAALVVYFLMVVNFQSWTDPFIIITALPGAICGVIWILYTTNTPFSVPALMGAIMSLGVATANSILVVTFANDRLRTGITPFQAALEAGFTRLRPVVMTASAMLIGMIPMALGLGEGGEQNAPLGRAVIGGLILATISTLIFVPVVFAWLKSLMIKRGYQFNDATMHHEAI